MEDNFFGITDIGQVRGNNEDAFIAQNTTNGTYIIACVIDGVGGYSGGEVAADIARKTILQYLDEPSDGDISVMMLEALMKANEEIWKEKQRVKEYDSMACVLTLALVDIENNEFYYSHVGDTRLYLLRDHSLVKISTDHSFVGFLEDSGRLTEQAAMAHPKRNEINKALGFAGLIEKTDDYIEQGKSPFLPGDMLLLCSDGLTDMVDKNQITSIITSDESLETKSKQLVKIANLNGGNDNITVVLVQNQKAPAQQRATMPAMSNVKRQDETAETLTEVKEQLSSEEYHKAHATLNSKTGLVTLLSILTIVFFLSTVWLYWHSASKPKTATSAIVPARHTPPNSNEIKLQALIDNVKGKSLLLSDTSIKYPVILTRNLIIKRDTLYIKAKGDVIIKADSSFAGTGLTILPSSKFVVIDSVQFEGFNTAISAYNRVLYLKNIRFKNCKVPVQTFLTFPGNKFITGKIPANAFHTDSLAKTIQ